MPRPSVRCVLGVALLTMPTGCIVIATPPATLTLSRGQALGEVPGPDSPAVTQVRAGLHPAGVVEELGDREYDAAGGAVLDFTDRGLAAAGPYLAVSRHLASGDGPVRGRVYVTGHLEWLWLIEEPDHGPGAGIAIGAELVGFVNGGTGGASSGGLAGAAGIGELGLGIEAGVDGRVIGAQRYLVFRGGARLRMPLSVAGAFFPGLLLALR